MYHGALSKYLLVNGDSVCTGFQSGSREWLWNLTPGRAARRRSWGPDPALVGAAGPVLLVPLHPLPAKARGEAMEPAAQIRPVSLHLREASLEGCASPEGHASPVYRSTGTRGPCGGGDMPGTAKRYSQLHREIVSSPVTRGTGGGLFLLFPAGK